MLTPKEIYNSNHKILAEIERNVPAELRDNLTIKTVNTEQEEAVIELLKRTDILPEVREKLETELAEGKYRFIEETENPDTLKALDEYYDREVKAAIADGRLTSPDDDPFYKKMAEKWDEHNLKLTK